MVAALIGTAACVRGSARSDAAVFKYTSTLSASAADAIFTDCNTQHEDLRDAGRIRDDRDQDGGLNECDGPC